MAARAAGGAAATADPGPGDLARLLATERRLEQRVQDARADAAAVVERARATAAVRSAAAAAELEAALRELEASAVVQRRTAAVDIAAAARDRAARYAAVSQTRVDALAETLVARVVEEIGEDLA